MAENLVTLCAHCHRELHRREDDLRQAGRDPVAG
jgi:predicted HNH restriction endonuclease